MVMAYPETVCLRKQMAKALTGKKIADISIVDVTEVKGGWRFGSITQSPDTFDRYLLGGTIESAESVANTVFLLTDTGYALALGYLDGRALYHPPDESPPKRSCLGLRFTDNSTLSVTIAIWGLIRALDTKERVDFISRWYGPAIEPTSKQYTWKGFREATKSVDDARLSVKKFLHKFEPCYYVAGIDSAYAIEILHRARLHPTRTLASLGPGELRNCYDSVNTVMKEAIREGGNCSGVDLFGCRGRFVPHVCRETLGHPCHECGTPIEKIKFEGGSSYFCPSCQPL